MAKPRPLPSAGTPASSQRKIFVNWIIPFLVLLPYPAKRNETVLLNVCLVLIVGRWLDLYLMVLPPLVGNEPKFGVLEVMPFVGAMALFLLVTFRSLGKFSIVPWTDPFLAESLPSFHISKLRFTHRNERPQQSD